MKHTYSISGMTCNGCRSHVEKTLSNVTGVTIASVDLQNAEATIEMESHIPIETFELALKNDGGRYFIHKHGHQKEEVKKEQKTLEKVTGTYYCPMHCEGQKTYDKAGDCPVCGMDLIKEAAGAGSKPIYTCPMHPEVIQDSPGSCPICGMDLVPKEPSDTEDQKTYKDLVKKMKIAVLFTVPIFGIAMVEMMQNNPLMAIMETSSWNWVQLLLSLPVVFYACWIFFVRAWKSIITWNLNMFTLIGIGTGVAFLFSLVGMFFPDIFPNEFKTEHGTVHLYFEATTVILTLVLLGQLLEARAHSQTSGAIKELLKIAPTEATL